MRGSAALIALLLAAIPASASSQQPEEVVVELSIYRGPSEVVLSFARDSMMLVPVGRLLELAEVMVAERSADTMLGLVLQPSGLRVGIDTRGGIVTRGDTIRSIGAGAALWQDGELYLDATTTAWLLDVDVVVEWSELTVRFTRTEELPVVRRLSRERRRRVVDEAVGEPRVPLVPLARQRADAGVLDWSLNSSTRDPLRTWTAQFAFGAQLLGGSVDAQYLRQEAPTASSGDFRASWNRVWPQSTGIRQFSLGEISSTGRSPRAVRGFSLSTAPFLRSVEFGEQYLTGMMPPGWELEIYRSGQLVGYTTVGPEGGYRFRVPVRYGPNPLELVAYGPSGEIRSLRRTFEIPFQRLPGGDTEYELSGGQCIGATCDAAFNMDARHGVSNRLTFRAGHDVFIRDTLPDLWHPYAAMSAALTRSLSVTVEGVVRALASLRADVAPTPDLRLTTLHTRYSDAVEQPVVGSRFLRHVTNGSLFWRPPILGDAFFVQASGEYRASVGQSSSSAALTGTMAFSGVRTELTASHTRLDTDAGTEFRRTRFDAVVNAILQTRVRWLTGSLAGGRVGVDDDGLAEWGGSVGRNFLRIFRGDVDVTWRRDAGATISLSLTTALRGARMVSRNFYSRDAGVQGSQQFEGTVLWNRQRGEVDFASGRSLGRAGLTGIVYLDSDNDGERDDGEPGVPDVVLRVGTRAVATDSLGRFDTWDLVPFEPAYIEIDTLSIANPLQVPARRSLAVAPAPNSFSRIELALVEAGEVSGRVVFAGSGRGAGSVRVVLTDSGSDRRYAVTTFSDGSFYILGVSPGSYVAALHPDDLDRLGGAATAPAFDMPLGGMVELEVVVGEREDP